MENIQPSQTTAPAPQDHEKAANGKIIGGALIALGAVFLLSRLIPGVNALLWAALFMGGGFGSYTLGKKKSSRMLMALAYALAATGGAIVVGAFAPGVFLAAYINFSLAAPFLFLYQRNKNHWGWLIPGGILTFSGSLLLLIGLWVALPAILIASGLYMLIRSSGDKQLPEPEAPQPLTGPAADK